MGAPILTACTLDTGGMTSIQRLNRRAVLGSRTSGRPSCRRPRISGSTIYHSSSLTNRSTQGRFGTASNDHHAHQLDHAPIRRDFQNDVSEVISE
jgi:hypothetical protein